MFCTQPHLAHTLQCQTPHTTLFHIHVCVPDEGLNPSSSLKLLLPAPGVLLYDVCLDVGFCQAGCHNSTEALHGSHLCLHSACCVHIHACCAVLLSCVYTHPGCAIPFGLLSELKAQPVPALVVAFILHTGRPSWYRCCFCCQVLFSAGGLSSRMSLGCSFCRTSGHIGAYLVPAHARAGFTLCCSLLCLADHVPALPPANACFTVGCSWPLLLCPGPPACCADAKGQNPAIPCLLAKLHVHGGCHAECTGLSACLFLSTALPSVVAWLSYTTYLRSNTCT